VNKYINIQGNQLLIPNSDKLNNKTKSITFFLHGFGANQFNNSLCVFPQGFHKLDNPYQVESYSWGNIGNYENIIKSAELLYSIINKFISLNKFNKVPEISIVGFSQGGMLAQILAINYLTKLNNLILLSTLLPPIMYDYSGSYPLINKIFISHGTEDTVIDLSNADLIFDYYKKYNYHIEIKKYIMGHTIHNNLFKDLEGYLF
jgi:predicted esterase